MDHPAHRLAGMAADAAEELRGYMDPAIDVPWELTDDDHLNLLPRLYGAVFQLAECIGAIAHATGNENAKGQLIEGARTMLRGYEDVRAGETTLVLTGEQAGHEPGAARRPAELAASSFPEPMTGHLLQAARSIPAAPPGCPAATARPDDASPGQTR